MDSLPVVRKLSENEFPTILQHSYKKATGYSPVFLTTVIFMGDHFTYLTL